MEERFNPITDVDKEAHARFDLLPPHEQQKELARIQEYAWLENIPTFYEELNQAENTETKEQLVLAIEVAEAVKSNGGLALIIGGYVRDTVLNKFGYHVVPKDIDIEVYGLSFQKLTEILKSMGKLDMVGAQFFVIKLNGTVDISIPRVDSKRGSKHKDFDAIGDPNMTVKEAARRRDLTINTMGLDPLTGEIIDQWGGIDDIKARQFRATDPKLFGEDPLRVLRVMQFAGRFGFEIEKNTLEMCRDIDLSYLDKERIREEWTKLLLKSPKPSVGLEAARNLRIIEKLHPELQALIGLPQEQEWHPEGDVWTHTLMVVDAAVKMCQEKNLSRDDMLVIMLASLCHDFGKATTTTTNEKGRIISHGHAEAGEEPSRNFLRTIDIPKDAVARVIPLVREHLFPALNREPSNKAVRRLANRLPPATIEELIIVASADHKGRALPWDGFPAGDALLKRAEAIEILDAIPEAIIRGRDLIELGMKQGEKIGRILREVNQAFWDENIFSREEALRLSVLYDALIDAQKVDIPDMELLNGTSFTKNEMIKNVWHRFIDEGSLDIGTLTMLLILEGKSLPKELEENKTAILTAHKYGPVWFSHLKKDFYETSWKSFYGAFEVNEELKKKIEEKNCFEQADEGLRLILHPDIDLIKTYDETYSIKPDRHQGKIALYFASRYPFEAGMFDGYRLMVQFDQERKRLCISVLDEDPNKVAEIDAKIREILPEFANARKVGYFFASDKDGKDNAFDISDAEHTYDVLVKNFAQ